MDRDDLRAFANRDWAAIARSKRESLVRVFREHGAAATIRAARELFAHARALDPSWPPSREREADLAHHVALKRALDRAAPVATAEDLIAMKILGGRAKDLDDVRALLAANAGALDLDHAREVLRQLEQALDRSDLLAALAKAVEEIG